MDRSEWFGRARALAGREADSLGWYAITQLADEAAADCADVAELDEVYVPYLRELAARWPAELRRCERGWLDAPDARITLARAHMLSTSADLYALPALLQRAPQLKILTLGLSLLDAPLGSVTLPTGHGLDTLSLRIDRKVSKHGQDVLDALPGWVDHLICVVQRSDAPPPLALRDHPLTRLTLCGYDLDDGSQLDGVIGSLGALPSLAALALEDCALSAPSARRLAEPGAVAGLRALTLHYTALAEELLGALAGVETLTLRAAKVGASALARARLPALCELTIQRDELTSAAAATLADAPWIKQLRRLDLRENKHIGPGGLLAVRAASAPTCELRAERCWGEGALHGGEALEVRHLEMTAAMVDELLGAAATLQTKRLHLESARLDDARLAQLASAPLPALRELLIPNNHITVTGLRTLAASPLASRLTALDVSCNWLYAGLASALDALLGETRALVSLKLGGLSEPQLPARLPATLRELTVSGAKLRDAHAPRLAAFAAQLYALDVSGNDLGPGALEAILSASPGLELMARGSWGWAVLEERAALELDVMEAEALEELASRAAGMDQLKRLNLSRVGEGPRHVEALRGLRPPALEALYITRGTLTGASVEALAPLLRQVRRLELRGAAVARDGWAALVAAGLSDLAALELHELRLTAAHLSPLLPTLTGLRHLIIHSSPALSGAVVPALLACPAFAQLKRLELRGCGLGPGALEALGEAAARLALEVPLNLDGSWGHDISQDIDTGELCMSVSADHIAELAEWPSLHTLSRLTITADRPITDADLLPLAAAPHLHPNLHIILDALHDGADDAIAALRRRSCVVDAGASEL